MNIGRSRTAPATLRRKFAGLARRLFALGMLAAFTALVAGCSQEGAPPAPKDPSVTVALPLALHSALVLIGVEKRYFAEQRLNVILKPMASGAAAIEALAQGQADVALNSETAFVLAALAKKNVRLLATLYRSGANTSIVARKDRGIARPGDLAGKRIGVSANTGADFFIDLYLELHSVTPGDIRRVSIAPGEIERALLNGDIDAAASFHPYSSRLTAKLGNQAVVFTDPAVYQMRFNLVAPREFADSRPEVARRFVLALDRALSFLHNNPEEAARLVMETAKEDPALFRKMWNASDFMLDLNQGLLSALEDEARWALAKSATAPTTLPKFLELIDQRPLGSVRPHAVSILLP
jgi:NitT/TauT family transport system substrate-binding protein